MKKETKFWNFTQNNSEGYFVEDDENGVCECVIIEAITPEEAWNKLKKVGDKVIGFWDSCTCCGDRWGNYNTDEEGTEVPTYLETPLHNVEASTFRKRSFVHYYDGTVKEFKFKEAVK